jgi:AP2 domain
MKQIQLWKKDDRLSNLFALVDDEDFEYLNKFYWRACKRPTTVHAVTNIEGKHIYMHNLILINNNPQLTPDHINNNGLDNQRENLRLATRTQQIANRRINRNNISRFKGISWDRKKNSWVARLMCKGVYKFLGYFNTKEEAAHAYNKAAFEAFGGFAKLNEFKEHE